MIAARKLVDREVIPQALALNPAFFKTVYTDLLNTKKTKKAVEAALAAADELRGRPRAQRLFAPVLDYLREAGDVRSASEIESHFMRPFGIEGVTTACEYLADQGLIAKASTPVRATKRSSASLQELAFLPAGRARWRVSRRDATRRAGVTAEERRRARRPSPCRARACTT